MRSYGKALRNPRKFFRFIDNNSCMKYEVVLHVGALLISIVCPSTMNAVKLRKHFKYMVQIYKGKKSLCK